MWCTYSAVWLLHGWCHVKLWYIQYNYWSLRPEPEVASWAGSTASNPIQAEGAAGTLPLTSVPPSVTAPPPPPTHTHPSPSSAPGAVDSVADVFLYFIFIVTLHYAWLSCLCLEELFISTWTQIISDVCFSSIAMLFTPAQIKPKSFESRRNCFCLPGVDASHVYVRAWAFHSLISTQTFRGALTASVDSCAEIKSAPSVA